jgi:dTDP-glucose 4,6-dehydratase
MAPSSPYSVAKAAGDLHIPAYARTFGVNASITRGSNTYGPNQYPEKLIPLMTTNALEGAPLPIYGDGRQIRDWLWVEDHCAGIELVLREGAPGEAYNVGGDDERENVDVVGHILRLTGADESLIRHVEDRAGHDRRYSLDTTKLRRLGWAPRKPFDEGIAETVAWYVENRSWWEPIKSGEYRAYYERQYAARLSG